MLSDQQVPWHDREFHEVILRYLSDTKPDGIILGGDVSDLPQFSLKFPWNPLMYTDPITSVKLHQSMVRQVLREYADASGAKKRIIVPGNHDVRFLNYVTKRAPLLHALEDTTGQPLISLESFFDARNLGYEVATDPHGMQVYPAARHVLGELVAIYHGWLVPGGKAGTSALAHLEYLQHSVIVAHTHRLAKVHKTLHPLNGPSTVLVGIESGTTAQVAGGLGHTVNPNWQQGLVEVVLFGDGEFDANPRVYANRSLFGNGERWTMTSRGIKRH